MKNVLSYRLRYRTLTASYSMSTGHCPELEIYLTLIVQKLVPGK